jgi:hypothetical protein
MTRWIFLLLVASFTSNFAFAKEEEKLELLPPDDHLEKVQDELSRIDMLIQATEENLLREKKLKTLIAEYRKVEDACIQNPKDTDLLFKLAKTAKEAYDAILETHLEDYFQPEFIKELQRLTQIANKKSPPPAR